MREKQVPLTKSLAMNIFLKDILENPVCRPCDRSTWPLCVFVAQGESEFLMKKSIHRLYFLPHV